MTKQERQNKRCFVCSKRESEHPGGKFCATGQGQEQSNEGSMILCLFVELKDGATPEELMERLDNMYSIVEGVYDATAAARKAGMKSTLEDIECEMEGK